MTPLDKLFTKIATEHLGISTLKTRKSDSKDFHSMAVWQVKTALAAAFQAGACTPCAPSEPAHDLPTRFDDYEIQPCRRYIDADEPDKSFVEPCEAFEADFWTVYGHIPGEGACAIGDFDSRAHALEIYARITGGSYD
jgi:hypothetical protein